MITIKNARQIELMREACKITRDTLDHLEKFVAPGISTYELDTIARKFIKSRGARPNFLNYEGFPGSICASINNQVIHGIPSRKVILKEGDIISIDLGAEKNGFNGDAARTFPVGKISPEAEKLIEVTKQSFFEGIKCIKHGTRLSDISNRIQEYVEEYGFSPIHDFVGHGIGKDLHEEPEVPNFGKKGHGVKLVAGMTLAIEPMINQGDYKVEILDDDWTVVTEDGKLSAHYENTVLVTKDGYEILTL